MGNDNPDASMVELSSMLGKLWAEQNEKDRSPFVKKATTAKAKYDKAMEAYKQTSEYAEFQKLKRSHNLIAKYAIRIPGSKKKNMYKTFPSDPNKPKRPSSAYFYLQVITEMK
eukprot:UN22847